ncbi:polysaccharide deacetylase family protein [Phenylobacterium sp. J367]|uniref:polysaccharide deacetylase family protein n=1 Tax=Phenylobacterium sp. J367 TaxID=2898435 RepID=UPI002151B256|nr:polysaccharide deacetylase family protein [Phenylobacterium sp. J367]MCR5878627.1 polysaccharide deacetylase family protein [Phenylobacterium sp. J367]
MRAFIATCAVFVLLAAPAAAEEMALTFDDLPVHSDLPPGESRTGVLARILGPLADADAPPAYGFVNAAGEAETGPEPLRLWRAAGHPVGNHTWAHKRLGDLAVFKEDLLRNEPVLEALGGDWKWFRYPFLVEGDTPALRAGARDLLRARGYRIASVTLTFDDYAWNAPYARCMAKGDVAAITSLENSFLAAADASLARARQMSETLYGRRIPLVLLMHVGAFDARMLPKLLALYRDRDVTLAPLETVMADPYYKDDLAAAASPGRAMLEDVAEAKGVPVPPRTWSWEALDKVCR